MKKLLVTSLITAVALCGLFAQEKVTFAGNEYFINYSEEFDDENNLKILCLEQPCGPDLTQWYNKEWYINLTSREAIQWHCGYDCHPKTKVVQVAGGYGTEYIIEDGNLKLMSSSRRAKQFENPNAYKYYDSLGMFHTPSVIGSGCYIEVKFKTPKKQGFNFTIYANSPHWFSNKKKPASMTSKGYMMTALDFMELATTGKRCPKNTVLPHGKATLAKENGDRLGDEPGTIFSTKNKDYDKPLKISGDEWFEAWHVFQAIVEDTSIEVYLDGERFCKDSWEYCGTLPEQCMELVFGNDQVGQAYNSQSAIKYNGNEPYKVTSYIDYVKVGQKFTANDSLDSEKYRVYTAELVRAYGNNGL